MAGRFFWKSWSPPIKVLYQFLLALFAVALMLALWSAWGGRDFALPTETGTRIEALGIEYGRVLTGAGELPLKAEAYFLLREYIPAPPALRPWLSYIYLGIYAACLVVLLSLATTLSRFWFFVSMGLLALLLASHRFETLMIFSSYGKWGLGIALLLYLLPAYYLAVIRPGSSLPLRLSVFTASTVLLGIFLYSAAGVERPFLHLAANSYAGAMVLAVLFAFMVGHELLSAVLSAITDGSRPGKGVSNLYHFLAMSLLLLGNAVLLYLDNTGTYRHGIFTVSAWWLLAASALLGIWGYRRRSPVYEGMYAFYPAGALLFLSLGLLAFATTTYHFLLANDAALECIEDAVVFGQVGYTTAFFLYVIGNFFTLLYRNVDFSGILYRPPRMPYFTARLAGTIIILALFLKGNSVPYYQAISGQYIALGDLHMLTGRAEDAAEYYRAATQFFRYSHRANYALAHRELRQYKQREAILHFQEALQKNPSPQAYLGLVELYNRENRFFDAVFTLDEALSRFGGDGRLMNNLGLLYRATDSDDSLFHYLEGAAGVTDTREVARSNLWAMLGLRQLALPSDTLPDLYRNAGDDTERSNLLALGLAQGFRELNGALPLTAGGHPGDLPGQMLLYNRLLATPELLDTVLWGSMRENLETNAATFGGQSMLAASALALWRQGELARSTRILSNLIQTDEGGSGRYAAWAGLMALGQDAGQLAARQLTLAVEKGQSDMAPALAMAYLMSGRLREAEFVLRQIPPQEEPAADRQIQLLLQLCREGNPFEWSDAGQDTYFLFCTLRGSEADPDLLDSLYSALEDPDHQAAAASALVRHYLRTGQTGHASRTLHRSARLPAGSVYGSALQKARIDFYLHTGDLDRLRAELGNSGPAADPALKDAYYLAETVLEAAERPGAVADARFRICGYRNPFYEEAVLLAAGHFKGQPQLAYDILLQALRIHPYSRRIQEQYILKCLELGLSDYAAASMAEYRELAGESAYAEFLPVYTEALRRIREDLDAWHITSADETEGTDR
jgi:tetratricopeptide (TPR) repeat protein